MADIERWLRDLGLGQYAQAFAENDIDLDVLPDLSEQDLADLGISLGHRKKLVRAMATLPRILEPSPRASLPHRRNPANRRPIPASKPSGGS
jgi:hypothetical protein